LLEIDKISPSESIVLYMNSAGGTVNDTADLIDYINRDSERFEIVCSWEMASAAFDLLLNVNCKIKLINGMFSRVHLFSNQLNYYNLSNKSSIDKFLLADLDMHNSIWLSKLMECGFTSDEIEYIKLGNTITCNSERTRHIIETLNKKAILV
jgi:hypothetical protein